MIAAKTLNEKKVQPMRAWADVGSHGGIFEFVEGPIADRYPTLLQIYSKPSPGLVEVRISAPRKRKKIS
jgi:hypothetical protein